ncbi:MAG: ABC transporter substrate-binding protein [Alphaproteobacteria bacterium]|nr:ABC transporter substrate-binding protein [Alphaproteobacteria bacterium]
MEFFKSILLILFRSWLTVGIFMYSTHANAADDIAKIPIGYISQQVETPPNLSNLDVAPDNEGIAGGEISIRDNNTTGRFLKQEFSLETAILPKDADPLKTMEEMAAEGIHFFILDVGADALLKMADAAKGREILFFNATATDNRLRSQDCRANVMHIAPSRSMYTDALAQFLARKRWRKLFLVTGKRPGDVLFAAAMKKSAKKFGGKIVAEKEWAFGPDARRTAQAEVPAFTQDVDYDVLLVADEIGIFGEYLAYRTWQPRLIVGTQGLSPSTWHRTHEQWGSAQLQSRFVKRFKRRMRAKDYQVWAPVRSIGEAAARTNSGDFGKMTAYLKGDDFELAGFKGLPLTFRNWNWQLRQPILLIQPQALVSVSPQEGFLHEVSVLDTLGEDRRETGCKLN